MKRLFILSFFFFVFLDTHGQENQLNTMVNESLLFYLENINDYVERGIINKGYTKNLYIVLDVYPLNFSFGEKITEKNLNYISLTNTLPYKKALKKGVNVILLSSIKMTNNQLVISFTSQYAKLKKKKHLHLTISDWGDYIYDYSCEKQEWILVEKKYGGV